MSTNNFIMDTSKFAIRLHEARLMMGLSMEKLAELTGGIITKQSISRYEKGLMLPKRAAKLAMAKALNISYNYFDGTNISIDMPMLRTTAGSNLSDDVLHSLEAKLSFWAEQYLAKEQKAQIRNTFTNPLSGMSVFTKEDTILAAQHLRQCWHCGDGPIPSILRLLERKGIKILSTPLPDNVYGLSTWADNTHPLMVIDIREDKTTVERLRFTAGHELAHLLLTFPEESKYDVEKRCDFFASFFLIPKQTFIEELGAEKREKITLEEMIDIKELYGQSLTASIIEARDYGIITTEYKRAWYAEHIEPNQREIGNGHYAFPETLGKEKRINSIIKSMEE